MALITRLARLWRADLNALLDRLEAPDLVLSQAVRDMEQALDGDRRALARLTGQLERLANREVGCHQGLAEADLALSDCLAEERDDLARALIRRRLEAEQQAWQMAGRRAQLAAEVDRLRQRISERETRLADLRARAALVRESEPEADEEERLFSAVAPSPIRDADVEIALLQAKRQRGGAT